MSKLMITCNFQSMTPPLKTLPRTMMKLRLIAMHDWQQISVPSTRPGYHRTGEIACAHLVASFRCYGNFHPPHTSKPILNIPNQSEHRVLEVGRDNCDHWRLLRGPFCILLWGFRSIRLRCLRSSFTSFLPHHWNLTENRLSLTPTDLQAMTLDTREDTDVGPKYAGFVLTTLVSYLLKQRRYRGCYRWKEKQQDFERSGHTPLSHRVVLVLELYWEVTFIVTV